MNFIRFPKHEEIEAFSIESESVSYNSSSSISADSSIREFQLKLDHGNELEEMNFEDISNSFHMSEQIPD